MVSPFPKTTSLIGYHGCSASSAAALCGNPRDYRLKIDPEPGEWLGLGWYFWFGSFNRALDWAHWMYREKAAVVRAEICLGNCLDLTDYSRTDELAAIYEVMKAGRQGLEMPENDPPLSNGAPYRRRLDCAIFELLHFIRQKNGQAPYDTVIAAFEDGEPAFPGAAIRTMSHVQIAVRDFSRIQAIESCEIPRR